MGSTARGISVIVNNMSYKHLEKKIPRTLDKRVKISDVMKENIKTMYSFEKLAIREIARRFPTISRRSIQFILFPERLVIVKADFKERRKDGRYYNKDKWREQMKTHRRYKQKLFINNKLV